MKIWHGIVLTAVGIALIWGLVAGIWGLGVATAGIYGRGEAHKEINSADFRIAAYESFFNQYASIKGLEGQIDELTATLALLEPGTREYNYTLTSLTGTKGLRHQAIQRYNADAMKDWTEGQFRDADLPYQIPDTNYPE
jgi:hypothetical protein